MYSFVGYIIFCADDAAERPDDWYSLPHRILRTLFWPLTLTSLFRTQGFRLYRLLNVLWALLILGWLLSLMADRL